MKTWCMSCKFMRLAGECEHIRGRVHVPDFGDRMRAKLAENRMINRMNRDEEVNAGPTSFVGRRFALKARPDLWFDITGWDPLRKSLSYKTQGGSLGEVSWASFKADFVSDQWWEEITP